MIWRAQVAIAQAWEAGQIEVSSPRIRDSLRWRCHYQI
jgi:hypothetical protein